MKFMAVIVGAVTLAGCQSLTSGPDHPQARASLEARSGSSVSGQVNFQEKGDKVLVTAKVTGLKPNSEHGFHVHEKGDCSAADAASAGGHFNPDNQAHGHPQHSKRHTGDMPNLVANGKGEASLSFEADRMRLNEGQHGILNRSVVVHANPDDYQSQPAGNSGTRIACGIIKKI